MFKKTTDSVRDGTPNWLNPLDWQHPGWLFGPHKTLFTLSQLVQARRKPDFWGILRLTLYLGDVFRGTCLRRWNVEKSIGGYSISVSICILRRCTTIRTGGGCSEDERNQFSFQVEAAYNCNLSFCVPNPNSITVSPILVLVSPPASWWSRPACKLQLLVANQITTLPPQERGSITHTWQPHPHHHKTENCCGLEMWLFRSARTSFTTSVYG